MNASTGSFLGFETQVHDTANSYSINTTLSALETLSDNSFIISYMSFNKFSNFYELIYRKCSYDSLFLTPETNLLEQVYTIKTSDYKSRITVSEISTNRFMIGWINRDMKFQIQIINNNNYQ